MKNVLINLPQHDAVGLSIQGPRARQEDAAVLTGNRYAVFDGLGGHAGGDVASAAAAQAFSESAPDLTSAVQHAIGAVRNAQTRSRHAMTTVVAVEVLPGELRFAWAGDSRLYLFRPAANNQGVLGQITKDHANPGTHTVLRCLGAFDDPEFGTCEHHAGDILLLCSDGLYNVLNPRTIGQALLSGGEAKDIASRLIRQANTAPCDNTTVIVIRV